MKAGLAAFVVSGVAGFGCAHGPAGPGSTDAGVVPGDGSGTEPSGLPAMAAKEVGPLAGSVHVALGVPRDFDSSDDLLIDRRYWVASYNQGRLVPNWVGWQLIASDLGMAARQDDFRADTTLPPGVRQVKATDYRGSGYDRGHMCPSADRTATVEANSATFLMTNMEPQLHALNGGPWQDLEAFERQLALAGKRVQIVAGGLFEGATATIGPGIAVPTASFKVIVVLDPDQLAAAVTVSTTVYAAVMPNAASVAGTKWTQYIVSVDEVERRSGYDLLREVADDVETIIEARVATPP